MPGLARWLTPGRSSCGSTLLFIYLFIYLSIFLLLLLLFFCFFLLLSLLLLPASSSWGRLPFLAGEVGCLYLAGVRLPSLAGKVGCLFWQEVGCLFGRIIFAWWWYCVHVWGLQWRIFFVCVVCHWPNQGWESTHRLHLYPLGGVFYSP